MVAQPAARPQGRVGTEGVVGHPRAAGQVVYPAAFGGPAVALKVIATPAGGDVSLSIDGGPFTPAGIIDVDPYFVWALPIAKMETFSPHTLTLRVDTGTVRLINVEDADTESAGPGPDDLNLALTAVTDDADTVFSPDYSADKAHDGLLSTFDPNPSHGLGRKSLRTGLAPRSERRSFGNAGHRSALQLRNLPFQSGKIDGRVVGR